MYIYTYLHYHIKNHLAMSDTTNITEIALNAVKTELSDKLESINFDSWLKLVNVICEAVDKQSELSGPQKKEVSIESLKHFSNAVGFDDGLVKMILDNASNLIDEVILLTKGVYMINKEIKKTGCFKKLTSCSSKKSKTSKTPKEKKSKNDKLTKQPNEKNDEKKDENKNVEEDEIREENAV
jgi:hypothetical protein